MCEKQPCKHRGSEEGGGGGAAGSRADIHAGAHGEATLEQVYPEELQPLENPH